MNAVYPNFTNIVPESILKQIYALDIEYIIRQQLQGFVDKNLTRTKSKDSNNERMVD